MEELIYKMITYKWGKKSLIEENWVLKNMVIDVQNSKEEIWVLLDNIEIDSCNKWSDN